MFGHVYYLHERERAYLSRELTHRPRTSALTDIRIVRDVVYHPRQATATVQVALYQTISHLVGTTDADKLHQDIVT